MTKRPEEILESKKQDVTPMIEALDKELEKRFEGLQLYIDEPDGLTSFGFKALSEHYNKHGWRISLSTSPRNERMLSFSPLSELSQEFGDGEIGGK